MTRKEYIDIENYMIKQMQDSAHDRHHVYRVLNSALDIAKYETSVDAEVLIAACLLHDIGRKKQFANASLCHAQTGSEMAYEFLLSRKWDTQKALRVKECILSHRYRGNNPPQSIEAKILFDADKLDASGALGIARTLIYEGQVSEPLYILDDEGNIMIDGGGAEISSFFQEYNYKLKKVYDSFYTKRAQEIAMERQKTAVGFYNGLYRELTKNYEDGLNSLHMLLGE